MQSRQPAIRRPLLPSIVAIAVLGVAAILPAGAANIIVNGGFESGTDADADNWNEINANPPSYRVERSSSSPASGSFHARSSYDNTAAPAGGALILQQVGAPGTIDVNSLYNLSFSAKVDTLNFDGVNFQVGLFLGGNAALEGGPFVSLNPDLTTEYQTITFENLVAGSDTTLYDVQFLTAFGAVPDIVNGLDIDNVVLEVVPEPGTSSLLLLSLGGLLLRRRRR